MSSAFYDQTWGADVQVVHVIANVLENHVGIRDDCLDSHSISIQFLYHWPASRISVQQLHIYSMLLSSLDIYAWATCLLSLIQVFFSVLLFFLLLSYDHKTKASFPTRSNKLFFILMLLLFWLYFFCSTSVFVCVFVRFHSCFAVKPQGEREDERSKKKNKKDRAWTNLKQNKKEAERKKFERNYRWN